MKACLHSSEEIQIFLQFDEYFVRKIGKISKVTKGEKVRESKAVQMFLQFDEFFKAQNSDLIFVIFSTQ